MYTTLSGHFVLALVISSFSWRFCFGSIWLLTNNGNCSSNGTSVLSRIREPVSVIFCVESNIQIHDYIKIRGNSVSDNWYPDYRNKRNMNAEITKNEHKAAINITFNHVEKIHINDTFHVTVYESMKTGGRNDKDIVTIIFQLVEKAEPAITSFNVTKWHYSRQVYLLKQDLLTGTPSYMDIQVINDTLKYICTASGYPVPTISIRRDGKELDGITNGTVLIRNTDCHDSGVYSCHAESIVGSTQVQKEIHILRQIMMKSFTMRNTTRGVRFIPGDKVTMQCSVSGCPAPDALTIVDDSNQTVKIDSATSSIVYDITSVQCSDMGTYYCRPDLWDGRSIEEKMDLTILQCPVQLCRGEKKSKLMYGDANKPVNLSVCVMSDIPPAWKSKIVTNDISVTFTKRDETSHLYYLVNIWINTRKDSEYERTIEIVNNHGILYYTITLKDDMNRTKQEEDINYIYIIVPVVLVVVAIIIGILIYRCNGHRVQNTQLKDDALPDTYVDVIDFQYSTPHEEALLHEETQLHGETQLHEETQLHGETQLHEETQLHGETAHYVEIKDVVDVDYENTVSQHWQ